MDSNGLVDAMSPHGAEGRRSGGPNLLLSYGSLRLVRGWLLGEISIGCSGPRQFGYDSL
jgi:hypothetical protein